MEILSSLGIVAGSSWAAGVNLYMTVAGLGIAHRMHWITLPGDMDVLGHPLIIGAAVFMYAIEFIADKIPYFDSIWDSIHTFIRPLGGAILGYLAAAHADPAAQIAVAMVTGSVAMDSHLTKATTRVIINSSPEPFTNSIASVAEDVSVAGILVLIAQHPIIAGVLVILFVAFSIWFLKKMFRFLRRIFRATPKSQDPVAQAP